MDKAIKYFGSYQEGYRDGYVEGLNQALKTYLEQIIISKPTQIIISKDDLVNSTCKECSLKSTEHCIPEDMALFDETTCKNFRV